MEGICTPQGTVVEVAIDRLHSRQYFVSCGSSQLDYRRII